MVRLDVCGVLHSPSHFMHRCLELEEILRNIADQSDRTGTVAMARTCRAFYNSIIDLVWRDLPGLSPLILCLPAHCWTHDKSTPVRSISSPERLFTKL